MNEDILRKLYIDENKTLKEIGSLFNVSYMTICNRLIKFNIPRRPFRRRKGVTTNKMIEGFKKISQKLKGKKKSPEHVEKVRKAQSGVNSRFYGKKCQVRGKRVWYKYNDKIICMRSNWEACYADWLVLNKINWHYEPKTFILSYGDAYTPDFFLPDLNQWVEVKGWLNNLSKSKINRFIQQYPEIDFILADKQYLKSIGCDLSIRHNSDKPIANKICPICQKEFYPKYKQKIFCSTSCSNKRNRYPERYPEIKIVNGVMI